MSELNSVAVLIPPCGDFEIRILLDGLCNLGNHISKFHIAFYALHKRGIAEPPVLVHLRVLVISGNDSSTQDGDDGLDVACGSVEILVSEMSVLFSVAVLIPSRCDAQGGIVLDAACNAAYQF